MNRKTNFELLRIIAMLLIICDHLVKHGILQVTMDSAYEVWNMGSFVNKVICSLMMPGGCVGVAVFFMITGYFSIDKTEGISLKKFISLNLYYSFFLFIAFVVFVASSILEFNSTIAAHIISLLFIPFSAGLGWYTTIYILLGLISNRINKFISHITIRQFVTIAVILWFTEYSVGGLIGTSVYDLARAVLFYILGGFVKKTDLSGVFRWFVLFIVSWIILSCTNYMLTTMVVADDTSILIRLLESIGSSLFVPLSAFALFMIFKNIRIKNNNCINRLAQSTYPVYLLHDSVLGRMLFWEKGFHVKQLFCTGNYCYCVIGIVLLVFMICFIIDQLRMKVVGNYFDKLIDRSINFLFKRGEVK